MTMAQSNGVGPQDQLAPRIEDWLDAEVEIPGRGRGPFAIRRVEITPIHVGGFFAVGLVVTLPRDPEASGRLVGANVTAGGSCIARSAEGRTVAGDPHSYALAGAGLLLPGYTVAVKLAQNGRIPIKIRIRATVTRL